MDAKSPALKPLSPVFKSGQSWKLKIFPLVLPFGFEAKDEKF
jgi:hypothetical protein